MISLPPLSWFIQISEKTVVTNIYTGSSGTDPCNGCLHTASFNYKVYVQLGNKENPALLRAEYNIRSPWKEGCQIVSAEQESFSADIEGIQIASEWLANKYLERMRK